MRFVVVPNNARTPTEARDTAFLREDNWNDYWKYQTLYVVTYFDEAGTKHPLGTVKIGQFNWEDRQNRPQLPGEFEALDDRFFSLGQDVTYYSQLNDIGRDFANRWLAALKDIVADPELYVRSRNENVSDVSLFRSVSVRTVEGQFRRVLAGDAVLTEYRFTYQCPTPEGSDIRPVRLTFDVTPDSKPPTNVHVIIGRNGVGKSYLLSNMT